VVMPFQADTSIDILIKYASIITIIYTGGVFSGI